MSKLFNSTQVDSNEGVEPTSDEEKKLTASEWLKWMSQQRVWKLMFRCNFFNYSKISKKFWVCAVMMRWCKNANGLQMLQLWKWIFSNASWFSLIETAVLTEETQSLYKDTMTYFTVELSYQPVIGNIKADVNGNMMDIKCINFSVRWD